jgi:aminoglycoside/choline kinase family phosphotransferase
LCDDEQFNTVAVDQKGVISSFQVETTRSFESKKFTFTGIQVLDPSVLDFIPPDTYSDIIDTYKKLMSAGNKIKALVTTNYGWNDIGTPERYKDTVVEKTAPVAFHNAFAPYKRTRIEQFLLKGDGSDRMWYRLVSGNYSLIMADHGIKADKNISEIDSYLAIGNHLYHLEIPVPKIYYADTFAGLVFMEDLGDLNLQAFVGRIENSDKITRTYMSVINLLVGMAVKGAAQFDPHWAYQTSRYSPELVVEKECRYFVDAFLNGFLKLNIGFEALEDEFKSLAKQAVESGINGFMHRDFQSRNIMVKANNYYFIDFQGGRIGPIQYDLASLLIDPYVALPRSIQTELASDGADKLSDLIGIDKNKFYRGYEYCSITRNLQILGAFGFLSRRKGKKVFENYIPAAIKSLKANLQTDAAGQFPNLKSIAESL